MTAPTDTSPAATELDFTRIVEAYLEAWNSTDVDQRLSLMTRTWAASATYTDPLADVAGLEAISAVIDEVQQQFTGMEFTMVGRPDGHHHQVRFQWGLGPAGAEPLVIGFDVVSLDREGAIRDVRGFLDRVPG